MLSEVFDQLIDEDLPDSSSDRFQNNVDSCFIVIKEENSHIIEFKFVKDFHNTAENDYPFVDLFVHFIGSWGAFLLDFGLEVWQKAISKKGDCKEKKS